jgi:ubiquinone/menaquinone biosynthesis C-methylase UbiE
VRRPSERSWGGFADSGPGTIALPLWRAYCDAIHTGLIREWNAGRRFTTALKTDLFDEANGDGLADLLLESSERVYGIDISESVVRRAAARHPRLRGDVGDVRRLSFPSGSIEFIVSNSTLDHFEDRSDITVAIRELTRVLTPGGLLLVTFDNPANPLVALRNRLPAAFFGRTLLAPYFVGHTLSLASLVRELREAGLEIVRTGYLMLVLRIAALHASRLFDPSSASGRLFLRLMLSCEAAAKLPTAPLMAHYVAALARKPER